MCIYTISTPARKHRNDTTRNGYIKREKTLKGGRDGLCNRGTCLRVPSEFMLADGRHPASAALLGLCHSALVSLFLVTGNWPTLRRAFASYMESYSKAKDANRCWESSLMQQQEPDKGPSEPLSHFKTLILINVLHHRHLQAELLLSHSAVVPSGSNSLYHSTVRWIYLSCSTLLIKCEARWSGWGGRYLQPEKFLLHLTHADVSVFLRLYVNFVGINGACAVWKYCWRPKLSWVTSVLVLFAHIRQSVLTLSVIHESFVLNQHYSC